MSLDVGMAIAGDEIVARLKQLGTFRFKHLGGRPLDVRLAEASGVTAATIRNWLAGRSRPYDLDKFLIVVRTLEAEAGRRGICAPVELFDEAGWRTVHAATGGPGLRSPDGRRDSGRPREPRDFHAPGRLLAAVSDPFALGVGLPLQVGPWGAVPDLPPYCRRRHDDELAELISDAEDGVSGLAVLAGEPCTGKTRACWEALEPLRDPDLEWYLWHPARPMRPAALLDDLRNVRPRTVIWLDDAWAYLSPGIPRAAEVARALRDVLRAGHGPIVALATMWPGHWAEITSPPPRFPADETDPRVPAWKLLTGGRVTIPPRFEPLDRYRLRGATDPRLSRAARAPDGEVIQCLAGVPELMARYKRARRVPKALIHAAMDARRFGMGAEIPRRFFEQAAPAYLPRDTRSSLSPGWASEALYSLSSIPNGGQAPLSPVWVGSDGLGVRERYRLASCLDLHGRRIRRGVRPPAGFWKAAEECADAADMTAVYRAFSSHGTS